MAKIGIDFGTTVTKVSYLDAKGEARTINFDGSVKLPSVLFYKEGIEGPVYVGQKAYNQYENAKRLPKISPWIARDLKRKLTPFGRPTPNPTLKYVDVICDFFKYIKSTVEHNVFHDQAITDVCITYPVRFDETKKMLLKQAAQKAGFERVVMLKEPFAAAMGYMNYRQSVENYMFTDEGILVYDFGGGTLDVTYVEIRRDGMLCPFPPGGDSDCGGENIDREIYSAWDKIYLKTTGEHIGKEDGKIDIPFLRTDCRNNKEELSAHFRNGNTSGWSLSVIIGSEMLDMEVTYDQWKSFIDPTIEKSLCVVEDIRRQVEAANKKIDKVAIIGGSSNIAQVSEAIEMALGIKPTIVSCKDEAVANGAAIFVNHGVMPIKCFCMNCGYTLDSTMKVCTNCSPKSVSEDEVNGWPDELLENGHLKNHFYDQRCEELNGDN